MVVVVDSEWVKQAAKGTSCAARLAVHVARLALEMPVLLPSRGGGLSVLRTGPGDLWSAIMTLTLPRRMIACLVVHPFFEGAGCAGVEGHRWGG